MLFQRTRRLPSWPRKTTPERCVFAISGIAGPGLPRSVALRAAQLGNIVAGWDIDVHGGQRTVDEIRSQGGTAHFFPADATRLHQVRTVLQEVVKLGPIAALVNLVGKAFSNDIDWLELDDDDFLRLLRRTFRVNAQSAAIAAREVLPHMLPNGGRIGFVDSLSRVCGGFGQCIYASMGKGPLVPLAKQLTARYGRHGVSAVSFVLGTIPSDKPSWQERFRRWPGLFDALQLLFPLGVGDCNTVANTIVELCLGNHWVGGCEVFVDGGWMGAGAPFGGENWWNVADQVVRALKGMLHDETTVSAPARHESYSTTDPYSP